MNSFFGAFEGIGRQDITETFRVLIADTHIVDTGCVEWVRGYCCVALHELGFLKRE